MLSYAGIGGGPVDDDDAWADPYASMGYCIRVSAESRAVPGKRRQSGLYGPEYWLEAFEEAGGSFLSADLEARRGLYEAALHYYRFTCAMTGQVFPAAEGIHPDLQVSAIQPLAEGGPLDVSNFIVLSAKADRAFQVGHLGIGADYGLLVDLSCIDPELLERLNLDGCLLLPADPRAVPSADAIAYHRAHIFARGEPGQRDKQRE
jgi:hypothetical protein